jgi:dTDP-4-amino-4,6-dideoxygalactose transaminase
MNIPFLSFEIVNQQIKHETMIAFETVFDDASYIMGKRLTAFEEEYSAFNNVKHTIGISNGLDALHIALETLGVGEGDEVIVPSHTYIATVLAVTYVGATPVFVEPDPLTYNIDVSKIEASITSRTKVIMPVHLYGQSCNMEAIGRLAARYQLFIVEDNAQAHGATWNKKITGSWGHINATSFYPGKNLGALGDAGAITTNDEVLALKASMLRNYGSIKKYHHEVIGYNQRLDELQAAFLSVKLKYIEEWTQQRQVIASLYYELLEGVGDLILPFVAAEATHVYHLFVIRTSKRDTLQTYLQQNGISTLIHYPIPVHLQEAYQSLGHKNGSFPLAEMIASTCLSLPIWPGMSEIEVEMVAKKIRSFF